MVNLEQYVVVGIVAFCVCLGYVIKHSFDFIDNKYIPLIMGIVGILFNVWMNQWSFTPDILLGGLVSGLAATGSFELIRNITKKE